MTTTIIPKDPRWNPTLVQEAFATIKQNTKHPNYDYVQEGYTSRMLSFACPYYVKPESLTSDIEEVFKELIEIVENEINGRKFEQAKYSIFGHAVDHNEFCIFYEGWHFCIRSFYCCSTQEWNISCSVFYKITEPLTFRDWLNKLILIKP